jgi:hypothetical protein
MQKGSVNLLIGPFKKINANRPNGEVSLNKYQRMLIEKLILQQYE